MVQHITECSRKSPYRPKVEQKTILRADVKHWFKSSFQMTLILIVRKESNYDKKGMMLITSIK